MSKWIEDIKKFLGISPQQKSNNNRQNSPSKGIKKSAAGIKNTKKVTNTQVKNPVHSEAAKIGPSQKKQEVTVYQPPITEQFTPSSRDSLQEKLNTLPDDSTLQLWPPKAEYPGPLIINHPMILDGQGATLWSKVGPVLLIQSPGVSLKNLRIEVTGEQRSNSRDQCAILVKSGINLQFDNIQVRGSVMGLPQEEGEWQYPECLNVGQLAYGKEYHFVVKIFVPVDCKIVTDISGLNIQNYKLKPGLNSVNISVDKMPEDTLVSGNIFLVSASLKRRITVTAHVISLTEDSTWVIPNRILWEPETGLSNVSNPTSQEQLDQTEPEIIDGSELSELDSSFSTSIPSDITETQDSEELDQTTSWSSSRIRRGETLQDGIFTAETNRLDDEADNENESSYLQLPELFTQSSNNDVISNSKPQTSSKTQSSSLPSIFEEEQSPSQSVEPLPAPSVTNIDTSKDINPLFGDDFPNSDPKHSEKLTESDREKSPKSEVANTDLETSQSPTTRRVQSQKISPIFGSIDNNNKEPE
ncbi:hypothetical protein [Lyngbya sp. CCY1209]|jgi:hypothetical protein|uniref:hypothetical protein n=1 Tax=Lyngbya sp. CCY1209 TaxID=2886103 RepID=UPI002D203966|nr:hypothetical protein [Lyngbya sp. CCY1209]MEB3885015.1 hypothetical protein [Lyngbya sp. CCY1209]